MPAQLRRYKLEARSEECCLTSLADEKFHEHYSAECLATSGERRCDVWNASSAMTGAEPGLTMATSAPPKPGLTVDQQTQA